MVSKVSFTDAVSKLIIENSILPRFRANDFAGGIRRGVDDIIQAVSVDPEEWKARAKKRPDNQADVLDLILLLAFIVMFLIILRSVARRGHQYAQPGNRSRRGYPGPILVPVPGDWGSSGPSWSGPSGGGFSGGGGSFGGGGASGSW